MCTINENDIETVMTLTERLYEKNDVSSNEYRYMRIVLDQCFPLIEQACENNGKEYRDE